LAPVWDALLASASPGDAGASATTLVPGPRPVRLTLGVLPERASRHNSPARPHAVTSLVAAARRSGKMAILCCLDEAQHGLATALAIGRALPTYSRKTQARSTQALACLLHRGRGIERMERLSRLTEAARFAADLVDRPPNELGTTEVVRLARQVAQERGLGCKVLETPELEQGGYGGLLGVGQAASRGPALVELTYEPPEAIEGVVALVGKGIVYDTGGLSLKGKEAMPGMKGDMAGAAAVLAAMAALPQLGARQRVHGLLCLAENSVGPLATRPDDILVMHSGRTVEVNNTDAEGRLVLADGISHALRFLQPTVVLDLATLTGAQLVATGKRHAALITNDEVWEQRAVAAGRRSGDLLHPLPYLPELLRKEFRSEVADLRNSVRDRNNAQSSCAAQFLFEHVGGWTGPLLHVDMAGPAHGEGGRGTGYGVGLLAELFGW
jgi:probable aminopeptidase NPEPL1